MVRVRLDFVKSHMHLARPVYGPDGKLVAGVDTALTPGVVRGLRRLGMQSVCVKEAEGVCAWEEDKEAEVLIAELEERFSREPPDKILGFVKAALRRSFLARAAVRETEG